MTQPAIFMSLRRWALSVFLVWHVVAIVLASLAPSGTEPPVSLPRHPRNDFIAAALTPPLDRLAAMVAPLPEALVRGAGPVRRLSAMYLQLTGVAQNWKMFSNPPQVHQYLRVRYYIGDRGGGNVTPTWTATELVLPAHPEDGVRLFRAYGDAFRDKAMTVALQRFHGRRDEGLVRSDTSSRELPDDIAPIGRYFARRFERRALQADERILRTEIWYGVARMPPPGATLNRAATDARLGVLREYYEGPVQGHFGRPVYPPYHSVEQEADIRWLLEYFEP